MFEFTTTEDSGNPGATIELQDFAQRNAIVAQIFKKSFVVFNIAVS